MKKLVFSCFLLVVIACSQTKSNHKDKESTVIDTLKNDEGIDHSKNGVTEENKNASKPGKIDHYICYTEDEQSDLVIWISFDDQSKARQVKYKGMKTAIDLTFVKESDNLNPGGPYPVYARYYNEIYEGKINGVYKLTHSGIWDYVEYTRGKDAKVFNFTIDHNADPYGSSPCF